MSKASDLGGCNGVRSKRVWAGLLGVEQVVVESVRFESDVAADGGLGGAAGALPRARGDGDGGAVGAARCRAHPRV